MQRCTRLQGRAAVVGTTLAACTCRWQVLGRRFTVRLSWLLTRWTASSRRLLPSKPVLLRAAAADLFFCPACCSVYVLRITLRSRDRTLKLGGPTTSLDRRVRRLAGKSRSHFTW